jgi:hypothetical protein
MSAACLLALLAAALCPGAPVNRTEYQIKAAFLLNFTRFVEWPEVPNAAFDSLTLCVLGRDPFGRALDQILDGQIVHGRPVLVRRIAGIPELPSCQVVFLSESEMYRSGEVIESMRDASVLTVGEAKDFALRGGVINFVMQQGKVRFQINLAAAARAHLKVNFRLLQLAIVIGRGPDLK